MVETTYSTSLIDVKIVRVVAIESTFSPPHARMNTMQVAAE